MDWADNLAIIPSQTTRKFDLDDACCLKSNPALVGHVCRTPFDIGSHEPLRDLLILSYTSVPETDLKQFLNSGTPPRGYVFVGFTEPSQGNALIHEHDLALIDRPLVIGQHVKRHSEDTMSGTVISKSSICSLEPIAWRSIDFATGDYGPVKFVDRPLACSDEIGPPKLHNVPMSDLVSYEELTEGDYIIHQQKVGRISAIDRDAILLLDDNSRVVSLSDLGALEVPISTDPSKLIVLPGYQEAIQSYPLPNGDFVLTTESEFVHPGQFVFTPASNLSWTDRSSTHGLNSCPRGHLLASPPIEIHVEWICPNVFADLVHDMKPSSEVMRASTLQGQGVKCDFGQMPADASDIERIKADSWLRVGDRVRFRDPKDAAAKYPLYQHIPPDQSFGHDINIFRTLYTQSQVTVKWQDGSVTTESATAVHAFDGAEQEVWPGNIVISKDSLVSTPQAHNAQRALLPNGFDDMGEVLYAKKVGVVQAVDSRDRIASVRWFRDPHIQLLHGGHTLRPRSYLGELDNSITEVSLYEVTTCSALTRQLNDIVVITPERVHISVTLNFYPDPALFAGPCLLSNLSPISFADLYMYLEAMRISLVSADRFQESIDIDRAEYPRRYDLHRDESSGDPERGFIGKIVSMETDGALTVRVLGRTKCRDFRIPLERILLVLDGDNLAASAPAGHLGEDLEDEDWETEDHSDSDEEEYDDEADEADEAVEIPRDTNVLRDDLDVPRVFEIMAEDLVDAHTDEPGIREEVTFTSGLENDGPSLLSSHLPSSPPPGFSVLDSLPPSDHHFLSQGSDSVSGLRLKRLRKEFEILQSSLPPGIFFRTWESRMDLARVLIIGPQGTPYEHAPFVVDLHFAESFPGEPPVAFFHSWTNGQGAINPNLYENGKICLSILGTWHAQDPEETWLSGRSTVLQVLVSITGLVLVKAPFYNEAGYEIFAAEGDRRIVSTQYTERTFLMARRFIKHAMEHPVGAMEDVLAWYYLPKLSSDEPNRPYLVRRAIEEALGMIQHHNRTTPGGRLGEDVACEFVSRLSLGAVVMLRKHITELETVEADLMTKA